MIRVLFHNAASGKTVASAIRRSPLGWLDGVARQYLNHEKMADIGDERTAWPLYALGSSSQLSNY